MSEAMSDVREAVQSHLPNVDMDTMRSMARDKTSGKRSMIAIVVGGLGIAAALFALLRRRS